MVVKREMEEGLKESGEGDPGGSRRGRGRRARRSVVLKTQSNSSTGANTAATQNGYSFPRLNPRLR